MSKAKPSEVVVPEVIQIKSMRDVGFQHAKIGDTLRSIAIAAYEREPSLPKEMSEQGQAEYFAGIDQRYNDINPAKTYFMLDGKYVEAAAFDDGADVSKLESIQIGVNYAMSMSGQAFGALRNAKADSYNPELYKVVGEWRDKVSKYRSAKLKSLKTEVKKYLNEGKTSTRAATDDFMTWVTETWLGQAESRCKVSISQRGDTTASNEAFKYAKAAFLIEYKKRMASK